VGKLPEFLHRRRYGRSCFRGVPVAVWEQIAVVSTTDYHPSDGTTMLATMQAIAFAPTSIEALTGLGLSHKEVGNLKESEDAFQRVLQLQPENALAFGNLAGLHFDQGHLELAVLAYQQVPCVASLLLELL
jgi:Flp pilus assembly protein TadD